uniref:Uncharacterized protein n=1 Tax=Lepeophtheirus salmonis TaxID=72036 RepID=A0A0K2UEY9_LEPSM
MFSLQKCCTVLNVCAGAPFLGKHIVVPCKRVLQQWEDMVPEDIVLYVCVHFFVGLEEVGRHLAGVGQHDAEDHDRS